MHDLVKALLLVSLKSFAPEPFLIDTDLGERTLRFWMLVLSRCPIQLTLGSCLLSEELLLFIVILFPVFVYSVPIFVRVHGLLVDFVLSILLHDSKLSKAKGPALSSSCSTLSSTDHRVCWECSYSNYSTFLEKFSVN
jgi:hypothetical protein